MIFIASLLHFSSSLSSRDALLLFKSLPSQRSSSSFFQSRFVPVVVVSYRHSTSCSTQIFVSPAVLPCPNRRYFQTNEVGDCLHPVPIVNERLLFCEDTLGAHSSQGRPLRQKSPCLEGRDLARHGCSSESMKPLPRGRCLV